MKIQSSLLVATSILMMGCSSGEGDVKSGNDDIVKVTATDKTAEVEKMHAKAIEDGLVPLAKFRDYSVVGLRLNMTEAEVRKILEDQGFDIPATRGFAGGDGDTLGLNCDLPDRSSKCLMGDNQRNAYWLEQVDLESDKKANRILPFFYFDGKEERLYQLQYERSFDEPIFPKNLETSIRKKYGEPSGNFSADDGSRLSLAYDSFLLPPNDIDLTVFGGESSLSSMLNNPTGQKARSMPSRSKCYNDKITGEYDYKRYEDWCESIIKSDPQKSAKYFAHRGAPGKLKVSVEPDLMRVTLNGDFLYFEAKAHRRNLETELEIMELEKRKNRTPESLDDL